MITKKCTKCQVEKDIELFAKNKKHKHGKDSHCLQCKAVQSKLYYEQHRNKYNARRKDYSKQTRIKVLRHYGGDVPYCVCCGETTFEFLSLDHINGGGNTDRKINGGGTQFQLYLIKNNFPEGIQILCHNCNLAKGFYGQCPHKKQE